MQKRKRQQPSYRQRKGYDQAIVTLTDSVTRYRKDYWLGPYDSSESRELYHRVLAQWESGGRRLPVMWHRLIPLRDGGRDNLITGAATSTRGLSVFLHCNRAKLPTSLTT